MHNVLAEEKVTGIFGCHDSRFIFLEEDEPKKAV